jgi:sigma-B regulation protein RsbU (phosphoserine phosphatase)
MNILIAEDDPVSRRVLENYLVKFGHEVCTTTDGVEAWEQYDKEVFPIVITDWMMPRMDGLDLVKRIRERQTTGYTYVIMLTAKSQKEDIVSGMEAGADDFLAKPFDRDELRVRLRAGERIVNLERSLAERNVALEAANSEIRIVNDRMKNDLEAAAEIQRSLLPSTIPAIDGVKSAWLYEPCDELAGDSLNIFRLDDRQIGLYVLDVSGHGVQAALLSVALSRVLAPRRDESSILMRADGSGYCAVSPKEVARDLNIMFPMAVGTSQYFTLLYGILDLELRTFRYVAAGHPGPVHASGGRTTVHYPSTGLAIGWIADDTFEVAELNLNSGDRLYIYSDGIVEASNETWDQFGEDRLACTIEAGALNTLEESLKSIFNNVIEWGENRKPGDDLSIIGVEIV